MEPDFIKCGVYNLIGVKNKNKIRIKGAGMIELKPYDRVADKQLDRFEIVPHVYGEFYQCNIIDKHLMSSKKQPLFYLVILLEKPFLQSSLFQLSLNFTIESNVTSEKEFLDAELDGKFSIEIVINNQQKVLDDLSNSYSTTGFLGKEGTMANFKKFVTSSGIKSLIQSMVKEKEEEKKKSIIESMGQFNMTPPVIPSSAFKDLVNQKINNKNK
jgi:hypothetical protein